MRGMLEKMAATLAVAIHTALLDTEPSFEIPRMRSVKVLAVSTAATRACWRSATLLTKKKTISIQPEAASAEGRRKPNSVKPKTANRSKTPSAGRSSRKRTFTSAGSAITVRSPGPSRRP